MSEIGVKKCSPHPYKYRPVLYTCAYRGGSICVWFGMALILPSQPYCGVNQWYLEIDLADTGASTFGDMIAKP